MIRYDDTIESFKGELNAKSDYIEQLETKLI